jgi:hypothetical protein
VAPSGLYRWSGEAASPPSLVRTRSAPANVAPEAIVRYPDTRDVQSLFDQGDAVIRWRRLQGRFGLEPLLHGRHRACRLSAAFGREPERGEGSAFQGGRAVRSVCDGSWRVEFRCSPWQRRVGLRCSPWQRRVGLRCSPWQRRVGLRC